MIFPLFDLFIILFFSDLLSQLILFLTKTTIFLKKRKKKVKLCFSL